MAKRKSSPTTTVNPVSDPRKKTKPADFTSGEDLINQLPDEILTQILSSIPTKSSVATSVLSKRWNRLWISVPRIDFDAADCTPSLDFPVKVARFMNFVDRVLRLNNVPSLRGIRLHFIDCLDISRVNDCISAILNRDAEVLDLKLPLSLDRTREHIQMYSLPEALFVKRSLVKLILEKVVVSLPSIVSFPSLEFIRFTSVQFVDDHSMKHLWSGCPVLKSLNVDRGFLFDKTTLTICSSSLRDLKIATGNTDPVFGYEVVVDAPNLRKIGITDMVGTRFDIRIDTLSTSLVETASLSIERHTEENYRDYQQRLCTLLRQILHVRKLIITSNTMRSLEFVSPDYFPFLNNVTHLEVEIIAGECLPVLPLLLDRMPNLVSLILHKDDVGDHDEDWYEHDELPRCLLSSLESVKIVYSEECDNVEMGLIYYILKHGLVLKKLLIQTCCYDSEEAAAARVDELLTLQMGSTACQIEYRNMGRPDSRIHSLHHGEQ